MAWRASWPKFGNRPSSDIDLASVLATIDANGNRTTTIYEPCSVEKANINALGYRTLLELEANAIACISVDVVPVVGSGVAALGDGDCGGSGEHADCDIFGRFALAMARCRLTCEVTLAWIDVWPSTDANAEDGR